MPPAVLMDPAGTESGLASSDASASAHPGFGLGSVRVGAYTTPLVGAIFGAQTLREANAEVRVVTNAVSRDFSVAASPSVWRDPDRLIQGV